MEKVTKTKKTTAKKTTIKKVAVKKDLPVIEVPVFEQDEINPTAEQLLNPIAEEPVVVVESAIEEPAMAIEEPVKEVIAAIEEPAMAIEEPIIVSFEEIMKSNALAIENELNKPSVIPNTVERIYALIAAGNYDFSAKVVNKNKNSVFIELEKDGFELRVPTDKNRFIKIG
jgi:hypothetical protein